MGVAVLGKSQFCGKQSGGFVTGSPVAMGPIFGKCFGAGALAAIFGGMDAVDVADRQSVVGEDDVIKLFGMVGTDSLGKNFQKAGVVVKLTNGFDFRNDSPFF